MNSLTGLRAGTLLAAVFAMLCLCPAQTIAAPRDKADLAWKPDSKLYLHYNVTQSLAGEEGDPAPSFQYVNLMGYEVLADGQLAGLSRPWVLEEAMFQLACATPGADARTGDVWAHEWTFETIWGNQPVAVSSSYEFVEITRLGTRDCARVTGTHKLKAEHGPEIPRWTSFDLKTEMWFDHELGYAPSYKLELRATKLEAGATADAEPVTRKYFWDAKWDLVAPLDTTETALIKGKVDLAITRGVERLWAQRTADGHWASGEHIRGGTALSLLALLMCGEDPEDARIVDCFALLKETDFVTTYDVGISIMAYEARYISKEEREAFLKGEDAKPGARLLTREDAAEVQRLTDWLVANRNIPNVMWNYKRNPVEPARYDFSVTQYALLGLGSAMRCGATIPTGYVKELVEFTLTLQAAGGPEVKRVVDYKPGKKKEGKRGEDKTTYSTRNVQARGWYYSGVTTWTEETGATSAYGSMTCAALTTVIAGLDIAANMDEKSRKAEFTTNALYKAWEKEAQLSLDAGMTWMEHWFSITRNPNSGRNWYYYYLYGLERVCMLTDVHYLGTHDWYFEGASALITLQAADGGWGGAVDTSFALLFLKRGTVRLSKPVYTGEPRD